MLFDIKNQLRKKQIRLRFLALVSAFVFSAAVLLSTDFSSVSKILMVGVFISYFFIMRHTRQYEKIVTDILDDLRLQKSALDEHATVSISDSHGKIIYVNQRFCEISGYSEKELIGENHRILKSGYHSNDFFIDMWTTIQSGRIWNGTVCNRSKNGQFYWVKSTIVPCKDEYGKIDRYISVRTDITAQKELDKVTAQTETRQKTILDNLGDGVYTLDENGFLTYLNSEAERILGWQLAEVKGKFIHDIIHPQRLDGTVLPFEESSISLCMKFKKRHRSDDEIFFHKQGQRVEVSMVASPLIDGDKVVGSVACFRDISRIKAIQEELKLAKQHAENAVRIKSDFLSTMSHEIRTPMNGVIGMADLLLDTPLDDEQVEFANIIKTSSHLLLTIINDILDFSKIEAGQLQIESIEFSLQHLLESSADMMATRAYEKSLSLMTFIDPDIPKLLIGDPIRIRQILLNFFSNAIKFTSYGAVILRATIIEQQPDEGVVWVHAEVSDSGIGISKQAQENLFKPFSQADSSTTRKYGGTGLGLSISKRLVELMGGRIGLTSIEDSGSTFWIEIPLNIALTQKEFSIEKSRGKRVLVVGENSGNHDIYLAYLSAWGCLINTADNVNEMLFLLNDAKSIGHDYDLLLLAELKIDNLLSMIDAVHSEGHFYHLPIIACQDALDANLKQQLLNNGVASVLVKPVKQSALFDSIVKVFHPEDFAEIENNGQAVMRSVLPRSVMQKNITLPKKQFLILLVEDNLVNQQVAQHLLGKLGYSIHIANHGKEALEKLATTNYALLLMDCQMPVMDGFETTRIIRESESHANKIRLPIIAMTANAIEGDKKLCLDAGMDDYMTKPISSAVLSKMLDKWLPEEENTEEIELFSISLDDASTNEDVLDESPINRQRLSALFDDDIDIINELLDVFCESLVSLKLKLSSAMDNRSDTIKAIAHEIKGSSYNVGALKLATLAEQLEKISLDKNWPEVEQLTAQIHIEMDRAQHFIQNNK